ncbi:hypothetical protein COT72_01165 [archaeon CG10_big_fil_rev_8_21_14_0_10_43_11]|nr:MAG: hypothetical protein COT72_01165 [archaeon CG10_big_fil_rev_8_21_14_0_10_43_11]
MGIIKKFKRMVFFGLLATAVAETVFIYKNSKKKVENKVERLKETLEGYAMGGAKEESSKKKSKKK